MSDSNPLTISKLASRGGVNVTTIRYYERRGLLPRPSRTASGYRLYADDAVRRLRFIGQAKEIGFSLHEIKELLSLRVTPGKSCADVKACAGRKMADIEQRIARLGRMKHALAKLSTTCPGSGPTSKCPILEAIETCESAR